QFIPSLPVLRDIAPIPYTTLFRSACGNTALYRNARIKALQLGAFGGMDIILSPAVLGQIVFLFQACQVLIDTIGGAIAKGLLHICIGGKLTMLFIVAEDKFPQPPLFVSQCLHKENDTKLHEKKHEKLYNYMK